MRYRANIARLAGPDRSIYPAPGKDHRHQCRTDEPGPIGFQGGQAADPGTGNAQRDQDQGAKTTGRRQSSGNPSCDQRTATELGRQLDCLALDLGLRLLAERPEIRLSINMSARSIGYRDWGTTLERHLGADDTLGERLMLEIGESSAMAVPELVLDFMDQMQPHGIAFALDNFGTGPTILRHLRDFLFDAVKIDGEFIRGIHANLDNHALVRTLIAIAREFDMLVIAEHVEEQADAEFLIAARVDCLQGYLYGAPKLIPVAAANTVRARRA